jgi:hypothetical protein
MALMAVALILARGGCMYTLLRAGATWAIRRSCCCEDLSYGRNRWMVNRVLNAASYSRITYNSYINFSTPTHINSAGLTSFLSERDVISDNLTNVHDGVGSENLVAACKQVNSAS